MIEEQVEGGGGGGSFRKRLLKRDNRRFLKYIESTPTHGVVHIFTGKSKVRRLFWLVIVLGALAGCLLNIVDRIVYLVRQPTTTTISVSREHSLTFPVVTICNLNVVRRSYLDTLSPDLAEAFTRVANREPTEDAFDRLCKEDLEKKTELNVSIDYANLTIDGRNLFQFFVLQCVFQGVNCIDDSFWTPTLTRLGLCYAFNTGKEVGVLSVNGIGPRHGIQLLLNIQQLEYVVSSSGDAGVKIAIHPQDVPGEPDDLGIAVPPGRNAFVSLKKRQIKDQSSSSSCRPRENTDTFNFLAGIYDYSINACVKDCFVTAIAEECGCIETSTLDSASVTTGRYSSLPVCSDQDLCCVLREYSSAHGCGPTCPSACTSTEYSLTTSYSAYPANYLLETLISQVQPLYNATADEIPSINLDPSLRNFYRIYENVTIDQDFLEDNVLLVNIYFEDLNLEEQVTKDAYSVSALLSDLGGQLGLFLGASVITMIEFGLWILDELKDRCCGLNEVVIFQWIRRKGLRQWMRRRGRERSKDMEMRDFSTRSERNEDDKS